jgi:hypothetical protein
MVLGKVSMAFRATVTGLTFGDGGSWSPFGENLIVVKRRRWHSDPSMTVDTQVPDRLPSRERGAHQPALPRVSIGGSERSAMPYTRAQVPPRMASRSRSASRSTQPWTACITSA